ncbi:PepSY domain-containing protein [Acidisoma sp. S159]|uniref:PepSY domain-containing protein n=1 Tax=Acidisoma sp. S159 TaxID=1747225 RepID=UPI00131BDF5C|nr:PepSY domain-containing protein [Acidisoma sp. S159]
MTLVGDHIAQVSAACSSLQRDAVDRVGAENDLESAGQSGSPLRIKAILVSLSVIVAIISFYSPFAIARPLAEGYIGLNAPDEGTLEIRQFASIRMSIINATKRIERSAGGTVLEIGFVVHDRSRYYSAIVFSNHQLWYVRDDAITSKLNVNHKRDVLLSALTEGARRDVAAARSSKIDISQAVERVERAVGGRVISVGVEELGGIPQYYIQSVYGDDVHVLIVNLNSGQLSTPPSIG